MKMIYVDTEQSRWHQSQVKWAKDILDRASKGEIMNVPCGHDEFIRRVGLELELHEDKLINYIALTV